MLYLGPINKISCFTSSILKMLVRQVGIYIYYLTYC